MNILISMIKILMIVNYCIINFFISIILIILFFLPVIHIFYGFEYLDLCGIFKLVIRIKSLVNLGLFGWFLKAKFVLFRFGYFFLFFCHLFIIFRFFSLLIITIIPYSRHLTSSIVVMLRVCFDFIAVYIIL
jgi:hypothetical protein